MPIPVASRYDPKICRHGLAFDLPCYECNPPTAEQKYCAHCDGGISEGPNEGDGSQFTCPECGGFFHRYRLNCHPDKFHAEPPPCNHPDYGQVGDYWVICDKCGKRKWSIEVAPVTAGAGLSMQALEPDILVDPAVAQLQRAVKQAGDRLVATERRISALEGDAHTMVENEYSRLAALEGNAHNHILGTVGATELRLAALEHQLHEEIMSVEKQIEHVDDKVRKAPWLEVWGRDTRLYSVSTIAEALGISIDVVREKLAGSGGLEVAEPVDSPYRHPDGSPIYDLDT